MDEHAGTRSSPLSAWLLWSVVLLLGVVLVYPIALTLRGAFYEDAARSSGWTLRNLWLVAIDPTLRRGLFNSLAIASGTTLVATLIALPLAILSVRTRFPLAGVLGVLVLVPMVLPPFVGAIGVKMILGREGALNALLHAAGVTGLLRHLGVLGPWDVIDVLGRARWAGVVCVQALALYPIIYLNASAALANLDPALDEAGENLGARGVRRLARITLPLIRPGLFAGGTIVFIASFTELGTPLMFDYARVTPVQVFLGLKEVESSATPYALTLVMLLVAVGCYVLGRRVLGGRAEPMHARAFRAASPARLRGPRGWAVTGVFTLVCALALVPHAGVVLTAFTCTGQWYQRIVPACLTGDHVVRALTSDLAAGSITNSLGLSLGAVIVNLTLGVLVGGLIVRTRVRGRGVLDALCMLPLAVPGLVLAFGYVAMSLRQPLGASGVLASALRGLGIAPEGVVPSVLGVTPSPVVFLIVAYAVRRLPYIVRATVAGLSQSSGQLEDAALNLGASRLTALRRVTLPLIAANLVAGALLVFSFSMLEVSDSLILAQQERHSPMTKAIVAFANRLADGPYVACAMGAWGMALLTVTLAGAGAVLGKKLGAMFRA